jgi:polysaccharide biosynthesis transport protein
VLYDDHDTSPRSERASPAPGSGPAITIAEIVLIVRRGWRLTLLGGLIGLAAAVAVLPYVPSLYKATTRVLIDRSVKRYLQANKLLDEPVFDEAETSGQIYVLTSESVVVPILRSMDLVHDPEFVGKTRDSNNPSFLGEIVGFAKQLVGGSNKPAIDQELALERAAIDTFQKRLSVEREGLGPVINVTFSSNDAKKAALIANTVVESYLESIRDAKTKSTKMAGQLLQERLNDLKQSVVASNKSLEEFKSVHNLVSRGVGATPAEKMAPLTTRLADAKIQLAEAKAQLERIRQQASSEDTSGKSFPDNQVIIGLRSKYLDLSTRAAELISRVGPDHAAVLKIQKEMEESRAAIREEEKRLVEMYLGSYQSSQARSDELAAIVQKLSEEAKTESQALVTLNQLEKTADSLRESYNNLLEKYQALAIQPDNPIQEARIITRASPPLSKNSNKPILVVVGGLVCGLLLGTGGALAREFAIGAFRTPEQVRQFTGIYCVSTPAVKFEDRQKKVARPDNGRGEAVAVTEANPSPMLLEEYVLDAPHSRFAESFRYIKALAEAARRENGDKVIAIVSPVASNGKSTTATNLAALMATSCRTLVIDADLHKRRLTERLEPEAREGLIEVLEDTSRLASLVIRRPRSGIDFLPCVRAKRIRDPAELLGSPQMNKLLISARETYDFIVIECAPIMSVVDIKMLERFVDRFVFVIEWGRTKRRVVQEALDEVDLSRERTLCFVLNKVDPTAMEIMEAYKGAAYLDYYEA